MMNSRSNQNAPLELGGGGKEGGGRSSDVTFEFTEIQ